MRYALVSDGRVMDIALWDGVTPWSPPEDLAAIAIPDGVRVCPGWSFVDGEFISPPPELPPDETDGL